MTQSKIPVFVLGYGSANTLASWFNPEDFPNIELIIIDNGKQTYPSKLLPFVKYQTRYNLGCAGGWSFICNYAFLYQNYDKILISNEDNIFTQEIVNQVFEKTTDTNIQGTYDRAFEFSLFGITKECYYKVGEFDENFLMASSEDLDYKLRCKLHDVTVSSLNINADLNKSETGGDTIPRFRDYNKWYYQYKWGHDRFKTPYNLILDENATWHVPMNANTIAFWKGQLDLVEYNPEGKSLRYPSTVEFNHFLSLISTSK